MALAEIRGTFRVGTDPETKNVGQDGVPLISFRAAASKNRRVDPGTGDNGSDYKTLATHWTNMQAWRDVAEKLYADGVAKGDQVEILGEVETQEWEKDGQKHSKDVVTIKWAQVWKKRDNNNGGGFGQQSVANAAAQQGFGGGQQNQHSGTGGDVWGANSSNFGGGGGFGGNSGGFGGSSFGGGDEPPF
ncbi:ssDNA binding protein [Gordonia phage DatBoi]|nr:ssDNA binding protein [Gordonia phage DatBoi]